MAFSLFKNPFESLSIENQGKMASNLEEIKDYFFKGNTIVVAINNLQNLLKVNLKAQDKLTQVLLKRQEKQMTDKDQKEMIKNAKVFGPALERIVGAIKDFGQLPEDAVDKFVTGVEKLSESFVKMKDIGKTVSDTAKGLMLMAGAIILFGLAIVIALPIYLLAILAAPIVLGVVLGFLWLFTKALGDKAGKDILDGAKGLMYMAAAVLLFGIALYLAGLVYAELWKGMIGMIAIVLTISVMIFLMAMLDGMSGTIKDGVRALLMMALVVGVVGIILFLAGLVFAELWKGFIGMIAILLTIGALVFMMLIIDMMSSTIMDGVKALLIMVAVVFLVGVILFLAGMLYAEMWKGLIGIIPILLVIGALIGMMMLIDKMSDTIYDGARALVIMVLAVALAGVILYVVGKYSDEMQAGLGASWPILVLLGVLIAAMYGISLIKGEVLDGALALGVISIAMLVLAAGLLVFKKAGFTIDDTVILSATLIALGLVATVLGIAMEEGGLPLLGALAMTAIGLAVIPLGLGLRYFKDSKFDLNDVGVLSATIVALGLLATVLGNPFSAAFTAIGAGLLVGIGIALVQITKSLLIFKAAKWTDADNESLNKTMASIIKAFSIIGDDDLKKEYGINASWFDIRMGVYALTGIGNIMTELARGIQSFANLTFTEYEVVKDKDGNSRIQPKSVNKLSDADFKRAGEGFAAVINAMLVPIGNVGAAEMASDGWFSGGIVTRGIEALTGIGNIMTSLAKGIQDFANLTFTEYTVINGGTAKAKIVPVGIRKLTGGFDDKGNATGDFAAAGEGFASIINAILTPIGKVGEAEMGSVLWFRGHKVSKGISALTGIGNIMSGLAKGIQDFASLKFTTYSVVNGGTVDAKIVPDKVITLGEADFVKAGENMGKIIDAILNPIVKAGQTYDKYDDEIDDAIEILPKAIGVMVKAGDAITKFNAVDPVKAGDGFNYFVTHIMDAFNRPNTAQFMDRLGNFTNNMSILINGSTKLEKVADSFERIADAFEDMKESINAMEIERLTQVTKLMGFLDSLASGSPSDIVANMGEAITQGMEALKQVLEEIKTQLGTSSAPAEGGETSSDGNGVGPGTTSKPKPAEAKATDDKKTSQSPIDLSPVVSAIKSLQSTLTTGPGIKFQKTFPYS